MHMAWVMGQVTISHRLAELKPGTWLLCEAMDADGAQTPDRQQPRVRPMDQSLVVFDQLGARVGDLIAYVEGREAAAPFSPERVPVGAYCCAILDQVVTESPATRTKR